MRQVRVLNVAEKPSVARALANVFVHTNGTTGGGGGTTTIDRGMRRDVHQIFEVEGVAFPALHTQGNGITYQPHQHAASHTMITTSVRGHLASTDFPPEYGWSKCDPRQLFDAPIITFYRPDMGLLEQMLSRLATQCDAVILWLDCDREGEAIGEEVRSVCANAKPQLTFYRARFSTVLPAEIKRALCSLGRLNQNMVDAVQARMELDLRVGSAFTRFQTLRLQKKFDGFADQGVVSYGPCQFPTLGFVVERWARIETFNPENFWFIDLCVRVTDSTNPTANASNIQELEPSNQNNNQVNAAAGRSITFQWKRGRLYDQITTQYLYESCLEAGEAVVTHLQGRPKNKWRPVPLATVELQKRASRYLRIGAEQLMHAADELYQQGYISYPRTETEKFRPEFQHRPLIEQFSTIAGEFGGYATKLLTDNNFQQPRAGQHDDQAHPPITPCKAVDPNTIGDVSHRAVYTLVVKHYLACCSRDALGKETQLTVRLDSEEFTAKGLMILEKNWLEIYQPWERWSTGQGELPPLQVGSRIRPSSLLLKGGCTTPPQPISETELITLMDQNGIGTDATIAQHISTIQEREYATKDANMKFLPTKLGIALVEAYNSMGYQLNKPDLRRETEAECNHVAAGRKTKDQIMSILLEKMRQCFLAAVQEAHKLDEAVARHFPRLGTSNEASEVVHPNFSECGICGNNMALRQYRSNRDNAPRRKLIYCNACQKGYGLPRGTCRPKAENDTDGGPAVKCPICSFQVIQIQRGDGYEGNGYNVCPKCFSDPPVEHGGGLPNSIEFRCFACQHPTCALAGSTAGGDVELYDCPFCPAQSKGQVCLRKNSRGYVLSCNKYSRSQERCGYTIWLPKECSAITVPSGDENPNHMCETCSRTVAKPVRKIQMTFKPGSVPSYLGQGLLACILCDTDLRRDLNISLPQRNQVMTRPQQQQQQRRQPQQRQPTRVRADAGRANSRRIGGRGNSNNNTGNNVCFRCNQPGHFANNCPNNQR